MFASRRKPCRRADGYVPAPWRIPMDERRKIVRRLYARRHERGVTLVEVMIVVAIMALISAGVAFGVLPKMKEAQTKTSRDNARSMRQIASQYYAEHTDQCPTPELLVKERQLDSASKISDAWGNNFEIICDSAADEIIVTSAGPNKKKGDTDDIRIPELKTTP